MNNDDDNLGSVGGLASGKKSPVVSPTVSVKEPLIELCVETLQLTACSGKPKTSIILSCERPIAHWEWRDDKSGVYPRSQGLD
jgi:hypothetical protein